MKIITETKDAEGLEALLGEVVTIFCACYIYTGKLIGVNTKCIKLEDASIVYETGDFASKDWQTAQRLPHKHWYVQCEMIESFGRLKG